MGTQHKTYSLSEKINNAWRGICHGCRTERNVRVHIGAGVLVVSLALLLHVPHEDFLFIVLACAFVIVIEYLNTAIEYLCDHVTTEEHYTIKQVKDVSAGAVLIAVLCSIVVGALVFIPVLWNLLP